MSEPSIPFTSMILDLLGEPAEHLLPQQSTLTCRHVTPPDRGDDDPGLQDVQHEPLWKALAGADSPRRGGQILPGRGWKPDGSPFSHIHKTKV